MNKFLKNAVLNNKDNLVKKSILTHLSDSVKEVQYAGIGGHNVDETNNIIEASNDLCTAIEAIFLHGLKDTISRRVRRALADIDERPQPSFWSPLLVISHKQIINQIENLTQITTEVGRCRAWIRLALNDSLLSSYLMTMRQETTILKSYYNVNAFIRDIELLEVGQRLIEGIEGFKTFSLPCNSSLLNNWSMPSLFLAGIWAPTMKACPVAPCDDVAQVIDEKTLAQNDNNSDTCSLYSAISVTSSQASSNLRQIIALNEDEALRIILSKDKDKGKLQQQQQDDLKSSSDISESEAKSIDSDNANSYQFGNSLNKRSGWSFDEATIANESKNTEKSELESKAKLETGPGPGPGFHLESEQKSPTEESFNALIESYNMLSGAYVRTPDLREVWQKFQPSNQQDDNVSPSSSSSSSTSPMKNQDVETLPSPIPMSPKAESISLAEQIGRIAQENGLDVQNYECIDCKQPLGIMQKPKVCYFTGGYYCQKCISEQQITIPARIIHNWDFKLYTVSIKSFKYLNEVKDHPIIDFKILNPLIYGVVDDMAKLQVLRNKLNFLRAYLFTCEKRIIEQLQHKMWPREYMYEHVHQYSISDLLEIPQGTLYQHLENVVNFAKDHVLNCWLCKQKGFVCEICNNPKLLFPFDVESIFRCEICYAVYHKGCLNASKPCPKCERRKKREDLPLLDAVL